MIVRRHRRGFTPAGEISIGRMELPARLKAILRLQRAWGRVADSGLAGETVSVSLARGTLIVELAAGADVVELEPRIQQAVVALEEQERIKIKRYRIEVPRSPQRL